MNSFLYHTHTFLTFFIESRFLDLYSKSFLFLCFFSKFPQKKSAVFYSTHTHTLRFDCLFGYYFVVAAGKWWCYAIKIKKKDYGFYLPIDLNRKIVIHLVFLLIFFLRKFNEKKGKIFFSFFWRWPYIWMKLVICCLTFINF